MKFLMRLKDMYSRLVFLFPKNDFLAFSLSFLIIVIHYFGSKWISKFIDPTTRRTLTHIGGGLWAVMWFFYETGYVATVFLIIVVIFFILAPKDYKNLFHMVMKSISA